MSFRTCVFHIRIVLPFMLALTVHAQDPKNFCPITPKDEEYYVHNQTCYFLSNTSEKNPTWTSAHNDCKRMNGSLLIFKDKSNEDAVITQITITSGFDSHLFWLDINKVGDSWEWTTGATVTYTPNWETGNGTCAVINVATKSWLPRDCIAETWDIGYICQYDSTSSSSTVSQDSTSSPSRVTQGSYNRSSRVTLDAAILLTLVLTFYRIFVTGR